MKKEITAFSQISSLFLLFVVRKNARHFRAVHVRASVNARKDQCMKITIIPHSIEAVIYLDHCPQHTL